jgi:microcystin-dependent protein
MVAPTLKHNFVSAKTNGSDNTLVQPSNWNDSHNFQTTGSNVVLGNNGGAGAVTEITCTAQGFNLLAAVDFNGLQSVVGGFSTGDTKETFKTAADTGWVMLDDGTIGDGSSGGTTRANADTVNLFTLLWNNISNADCPVSSGRGGTAAADFAAHKTINLPLSKGRTFIGAGTGAGLTARTLGHAFGEESHALTVGELPAHTHNYSGTTGTGTTGSESATHSHVQNVSTPSFGTAGVGYQAGGSPFANSATATTGSENATHTHAVPGLAYSGTTDNGTGGGGAHNVMQPSNAVNRMIKL